MKKIMIVAVALAAFLSVTGTAQAEPENPIVYGNLEVQLVGGGKVTGTGIDCGNGATDCAQRGSWRDNELPPTNRLTATPNTGWAFLSWSNCTPVSGQANRCDASYGTEEPNEVIARFTDVQAPSVFLQSPAVNAKAGNSVYASVTTSDNDRVSRVEYLIDGQVVRNTATAPFDATIDLTGVSEGVHQLQARSFDPAGNNGITAARVINVDHTGPAITLPSPVVATNSNRPQFSFGNTSEDLSHAACTIRKTGSEGTFSPCAALEWFAGDTPEEGDWQFVVRATDNVGNLTQVVHDFVVDRTAPVAAFSSGPADGSVVEVGNVKYEWTVTDGLPVAQECVWDNGEKVACNGSAARGLTAGSHTFKVTLTDLAGNQTTLSRAVTVKKDGNVPDPNPDPDPDTTDRTPPVVKLVAPKQKLRGLRKALKLNVRCNEACSGQVVVKAKGIKLAGRVALSGAGVQKLKLRPNAKVRKRIASMATRSLRKRKLNLVAVATLMDRSGNTGRSTLKFRVKD